MQKIIVSNPAIGSESYGLTNLGKEQAQKVLILEVCFMFKGMCCANRFLEGDAYRLEFDIISAPTLRKRGVETIVIILCCGSRRSI